MGTSRTPEQFTRFLDGKNPLDGNQLYRPPRGERTVKAFDNSFSAPKSASVMWAAGSPEVQDKIAAAHRKAVEAGLKYIENEAITTRLGRGGAREVKGQGIVAMVFDHSISREGEPQLHSHALIANMTRTEDGRWRTLNSRRLFEHAKTGGYVYQASLREEMTRTLGVEWTKVVNGQAEVKGFPREAIEHFSTRRQKTLAHLDELNIPYSPRAAAGAVLATRPMKPEMTDEKLRANTLARAQEYGYTPEVEQDILGRVAARHALAPEHVVASQARKLGGRGGLTEKQNTFSRRDAVQGFLEAAPTGMSTQAEARADQWLNSDDRAVKLGPDLYTNRDLLAKERAILDSHKRRQTEGSGVLNRQVVDDTIAHWRERGIDLTEEQRQVVHELTSAGRGIETLNAHAGTGKTTVLGVTAEAYERSGYRVIGAAPTGKAAQELGDARQAVEGKPIEARTLDSWEARQWPALNRRTVVIADESSMAATYPLNSATHATEQAQSKTILAGDSGQLQSVGAGGAFHTLAEREGTVTLREVIRQKDPAERSALAELHDRRPDQWIAHQQKHGRLEVHSSREEAIQEAITDWRQDRQAATTTIFTHSNELRHDLNQRIRGELAQSGELTGPALEVKGREFQAGDRIILRQNDPRLDVWNGNLATIVSVDPDHRRATLATDRGAMVDLPPSYIDRPLANREPVEHAYAVTKHSGQGATYDRAQFVGRPEEVNYTAATRHRESFKVHLIDQERDPNRHHEAPDLGGAIDRMRQAMSQPDRELLATEQARRAARDRSQEIIQSPELAKGQGHGGTTLVRSPEIASHEPKAPEVPDQAQPAPEKAAQEVTDRPLPDPTRERIEAYQPPTRRDELRHQMQDAREAHSAHEQRATEAAKAQRERDYTLKRYDRHHEDRARMVARHEALPRFRARETRRIVEDQITQADESYADERRTSGIPDTPEARQARVAQPDPAEGRRLGEAREAAYERLQASEPPGHLTEALGEVPHDPQRREAWDRGAHAIEGYRKDHAIEPSNWRNRSKAGDHALGQEPLGSKRRHEWLRAGKEALQARLDLGQDIPDAKTLDGQICQQDGLSVPGTGRLIAERIHRYKPPTERQRLDKAQMNAGSAAQASRLEIGAADKEALRRQTAFNGYDYYHEHRASMVGSRDSKSRLLASNRAARRDLDRQIAQLDERYIQHQQRSGIPDTPEARQVEVPRPTDESHARLVNDHRAAEQQAKGIQPPTRLTRTLGEVPEDPQKREAWDKGAYAIEAYREDHDISQERSWGREPSKGDYALGREPSHEPDRSEWREAGHEALVARRERPLDMPDDASIDSQIRRQEGLSGPPHDEALQRQWELDTGRDLTRELRTLDRGIDQGYGIEM